MSEFLIIVINLVDSDIKPASIIWSHVNQIYVLEIEENRLINVSFTTHNLELQCERDPTQLFHPVTLQFLKSI